MRMLPGSAWAPEARLYVDTCHHHFDSSSVFLFPVCGAAGARPVPGVPGHCEASAAVPSPVVTPLVSVFHAKTILC